ncbi:MAG: hypothetical protein RLZZ618_4048 [Pseudomonadota bacterium]|jgi:coenzyme F420-reducing hydrogenase beta subunit
MSDHSDLVEVISSQTCVGCGACAAVTPSISMQRTELGRMVPILASPSAPELARASSVCPFSSHAKDETAIATEWFSDLPKFDPRVGRYLGLHAGRILDDAEILGSSSGGLTTWLCKRLLETGAVDGVVHLGEGSLHEQGGDLFEFRISRSVAELRQRRKSQYYSASVEQALKHIQGDGKRYAVIGVPCYIKAVRLLMGQDEALRAQLVLTMGLVCGHMKSAAFAEMMAWQVGVPPEQLKAVDFRQKSPGKTASEYNFAAVAKELGSDEADRQKQLQHDPLATHHVAKSSHMVGGNWGHAMFQLRACDFCDDIFAETADVVFGDAWIAPYSNDWRGTNVVVNRHPLVAKLFQEGHAAGQLMFDDISVAALAETQAGNFRHRWDGLSVRLQDAVRAGRWVPRKRIQPGSRRVTAQRVRIVRLREQMAAASHGAFLAARREHSLQRFFDEMNPLIAQMDTLARPSLWSRVQRKAGRIARRVVALLRSSPVAVPR